MNASTSRAQEALLKGDTVVRSLWKENGGLMHVRISTIRGATDIDAGIRLLGEKVVPELQQQRGFRGITASADRAGGIVAVVSLWETEQDMTASESAAGKVRRRHSASSAAT